MTELATNIPFKISTSDPVAAIVAEEPIVIGQLGQALDGSIATRSGDSKYINSKSGLMHLHRLRSAVDAVIVGVESVNMDDPKLTVRLCAGEDPVKVVIDPNNRVNTESEMFRCTKAKIVIVTDQGVEHTAKGRARVVKIPRNQDGIIDPVEIVRVLRKLGMKRILVEGGNKTLSKFIDAGILDRLHLIVAPMLIGAGVSGLALAKVLQLKDAIRPEVTVHPLGSDIVFDCKLSS